MKDWVLGLVSISVSVPLQVGITEFGAGLDQSVWRLTSDSQVECRLEHPIPRWGTGAFVSRTGRKINLDFELKGLRPQARTQRVSLGIMPPLWRPGVAGREISQQLFVDLGIEEGKISMAGHGEKQHVASNETEAGRARNRRVLINMGRDGTI